eukprot:jgi/Chrpa1/10451/Chrysochromulina_OHIO_Genome00005950-RA
MDDGLAPRVKVVQPCEDLVHDGLGVLLGQRPVLAQQLGEGAAIAILHHRHQRIRIQLEDGEGLHDAPVARVDGDVDLALHVAHEGLLALRAPLLRDVVQLARRVAVRLQVVHLEHRRKAAAGDQVEEDEPVARGGRERRRVRAAARVRQLRVAAAARPGLEDAARILREGGAVSHLRIELIEIAHQLELVEVLVRLALELPPLCLQLLQLLGQERAAQVERLLEVGQLKRLRRAALGRAAASARASITDRGRAAALAGASTAAASWLGAASSAQCLAVLLELRPARLAVLLSLIEGHHRGARLLLPLGAEPTAHELETTQAHRLACQPLARLGTAAEAALAQRGPERLAPAAQPLPLSLLGGPYFGELLAHACDDGALRLELITSLRHLQVELSLRARRGLGARALLAQRALALGQLTRARLQLPLHLEQLCRGCWRGYWRRRGGSGSGGGSRS